MFRRTSPETHPEGAGARELIGDGFRGRPDVDLRDYAAARRLDHRGQANQLGYLAAMPMSEELQFNVLRGELPGGEPGILFHEVELVRDGAGGSFYGTYSKAPPLKGPMDLLGRLTINGEAARFKVPHTAVAVRVPEAQGALVGFQVGRRSEGAIAGGDVKVGLAVGGSKSISSGPQHWSGRKLDDDGFDGWQFAWRSRGQEEALAEVLEGPVKALLAAEQPPRLSATFRFGVLWLRQQQFAKREGELDELAGKAVTLARDIRAIAERASRRCGLDERLPEPDWAGHYRQAPDDTFIGGDSQDLGTAAGVAIGRGLELEDAFAFARGFSDLGWPGEPYVAARGELAPGRSGRLAMTLSRKASSSGLNAYLEEKIAGPFGCNLILVPLRDGIADTPGEQVDWATGGPGAYTVRRGILSAWRARGTNHADPADSDRLIADALALADSLA